MQSVAFKSLSGLRGSTLRSAAAIRIDQALVDRFVNLSGDRQWIHCDAARAAVELPNGATIVPGGLLLTLLPRLLQQTYTVTQVDRSYLAAYRNVKFHRTLNTGSTVGLTVHFTAIRPTRTFVRVGASCEVADAKTGLLTMSADVVDVYYPEKTVFQGES